MASRNGQQYFIIYIGSCYSRYDYLYQIHAKSQSLDVFKTFKVKVENQLNKRKKKTLSLTMVVNTIVDLTDQVVVNIFFLVLYIDDILLITNDICLLYDTKRFLLNLFEMKTLVTPLMY